MESKRKFFDPFEWGAKALFSAAAVLALIGDGAARAGGGGGHMKRFAFFPGCLIPARHPGMEAAIRTTLTNLGIEIVDLEGASCCPDPIYFKSKDKVSWLSVAARNLCLAEDLGLDIFTNCSGCTATLSETYHLLQDEELRERVNIHDSDAEDRPEEPVGGESKVEPAGGGLF